MAAATLRILARNIESAAFNREDSGPLRIQFSDFSIEYLHQSDRSRLDYAKITFDKPVEADKNGWAWDFTCRLDTYKEATCRVNNQAK
jgi:hypothetical protein